MLIRMILIIIWIIQNTNIINDIIKVIIIIISKNVENKNKKNVK